MLTAPSFSPLRRPDKLKHSVSTPQALLSPGSLSNGRKKTGRRQQYRSSRSIASSQSDDYDSESHSPTPGAGSWKEDLDQWLEKRERSPAPVLGHDGMPREERKKAIGNALTWLRDEMGKMRQEDKQLKEDFTNLYSDVHMLKMEAMKTQTMLRCRSVTSMSSLSLGSDEDSDTSSLFDFPDSSMVGNMSANSLIGRQKYQRKMLTPRTPPSLRRKLLGPVSAQARRQNNASPSSEPLGSPKVHSTPIHTSSSDRDRKQGAPRMSQLLESADAIDSVPKPVSPVPHKGRVSPEAAREVMDEDEASHQGRNSHRTSPSIDMTSSKSASPVEEVAAMDVPVVCADSSNAGKSTSAEPVAIANQEHPKTEFRFNSNTTQMPARSDGSYGQLYQPRQSHQPVPQKMEVASLPASMTTPERPVAIMTALPSNGHHLHASLSQKMEVASLPASMTTPERPVAVMTAPPSNGHHLHAYISPPNITQRQSSQPSSAVHSSTPYGHNQHQAQRQQVMKAAASLQIEPTGGGTLPRMHRKGHRRSSSSTSIGKEEDATLQAANSSNHLQPVRPAPELPVVPIKERLFLEDVPGQSTSMPSIRNASEDMTTSSRLRKNANAFSKYDSFPSSEDLAVQVPVSTSAGLKQMERNVTTPVRPQALPPPFFQPSSARSSLRGFSSWYGNSGEPGIPSPLLEDTQKEFHHCSHVAGTSQDVRHAHRTSDDISDLRHQHHPPQQYFHARHHSADYTGALQNRTRPDVVSPLSAGPHTELSRRVSLDSATFFQQRNYPAVNAPEDQKQWSTQRAHKPSLSVPASPGVIEARSSPGSPKVCRSQSDVQRNLAKTAALRCAQAVAVAPPSPNTRARSHTMFPFPSTEDDPSPPPQAVSRPAKSRAFRPNSLESLV